MALTPGTRLGPYEVTALIGEGGMGKVWRAHHTALKRDDALKVLPDAFASDPDRLARFRREAQVLASLNHPNIAHVHGLEQSDGVQALVMELVEGPTLADRIAQGPIPVDEALPIARQIAEALEAAHERGIIHRDLKPANIKVRPDGTVKVLDFGLAKALEPVSDAGIDATASPTITSPAMMTGVGMLLGTAAYMSPEQARGKAVDKRSDIWAFGCVLYEMLTGVRAFGADEVSDTLALVLTRDCDWRALPAGTPGAIRRLLERCMDRDPRRRLRDVGEARLVLEGALETKGLQPQETEGGGRRGQWPSLLAWAVAGAALLVGGVVVWWPREPLAPNPSATRFLIRVDGELPLRLGHHLALSPDGRDLVYRAQTEQGDQLYRRSMNALDSVPIIGSQSGTNPFFSPDGRSLGFAAPDGLKTIRLSEGLVTTVCTCSVSAAAWGPDGTIVFVDLNTNGLARVPSTGGNPEPLTMIETGETYHDEPEFLPGGKAVLFTIWSGSLATARIAVVSLETKKKEVLDEGFYPRWSPTGHILYARTGASMWKIPFDESRLEKTGETSRVLDGVRIEGGGSVQFALAQGSGTMAYIPSGTADLAQPLVWVDRENGREEPLAAESRGYSSVKISPDGTRIALEVENQESLEDVYVYDVARGTTSRLTLDAVADQNPLWIDQQRIVFKSDAKTPHQNDRFALFQRRADGTQPASRIASLVGELVPSSLSPDGQALVYEELKPDTGWDVGMLSLAGEPNPRALLNSNAVERYPRFSPDGRWLAYSSDGEVFVVPFPDVKAGGPYQISQSGGTEPLWSPDWSAKGGDIYYRRGNAVWAASVEPTPSFVTTRRRSLFSGSYRRSLPYRTYSYDIDPKGNRFLMIRETRENEIVVVLNWLEELKRLVPTN